MRKGRTLGVGLTAGVATRVAATGVCADGAPMGATKLRPSSRSLGGARWTE